MGADRPAATGHAAHVVVTIAELLDDPYARRRGLVRELDDGELTIGSPPRLSTTPVRVGPPATLPGIDGRAIAEELGLAAQWPTLVASGTVVDVVAP